MTEPDPVPHWPGRPVELGDHQVYVRSVPGDGGEPALGEPALCVHGLAGSSRNWTDLMVLLRPRLAADALDLPGFGGSPPRPDGRYSVAALAQTVAALIERKHGGPVHLIASSLGGAVSVKLAAARPELIKSLTLISPALPDWRPHLDQVQFALISLPGIGATRPGATRPASPRPPWSSTAATTVWSARAWRAGPRTPSPPPGSWSCPAPATSPTWNTRPRSPP